MSKPETNTIITIGRQFGSAGLAIGRQVAHDLGIKLYYKEILDEIIPDDLPANKSPDVLTGLKHKNSMIIIKGKEIPLIIPFSRKYFK